MMRKSKKGFTLVELLVVIAIIAIIAAVAIPVTIGQVKNSKIKTCNQEVVTIGKAVETAIGAVSADPDATMGPAAIGAAMKISAPTYIASFTISAGGKIACTLKGGTGLADDDEGIKLTYQLSSDFVIAALAGSYSIEGSAVSGS